MVEEVVLKPVDALFRDLVEYRRKWESTGCLFCSETWGLSRPPLFSILHRILKFLADLTVVLRIAWVLSLSDLQIPPNGSYELLMKVPVYTLDVFLNGRIGDIHILFSTYDEEMCIPLSH